MYKRKIKLVASDFETGDELFSTEEHRITFEVDIGLSQGLATAKIVIYNLSDGEVKDLTRTDLEPISTTDGTSNRKLKKVRVRLFAGYEDEVEGDLEADQMMIEGYVMNATSVKKLPSKLTYLYIIAYGSNFLINEFESFTTPGKLAPVKMKLRDVLDKITVSAGYDVGAVDYLSAPVDVINQEIIGKPFNNTSSGMFAILNSMAKEYSFSWGIKAKGIGIYPILRDSQKDSTEFNVLQKDGARLKIDPIKVRGTPISGMATLEINHALDATLFPGKVIDVGEINGNGDNDSLPDNGIIDYTALGKSIFYTNDVAKYAVHQYYMLYRVVHKGDTHGDEWSTTLVCKTPSSGITSDKEIN